MKRFYHENIDSNSKKLLISGKEAHHINNVMRIRTSEKIAVTDGRGFLYEAVVKKINKNEILLEIVDKKKEDRESPIKITIAFAMLKGKKTDNLIKPLTETGVSKIIPFISERSVSLPDERKKKNKRLRWIELSKESLKQCERTMLPDIYEIETFEKVLLEADNYDLKILFYERSLIPLKKICKKYKNPEKIFILTGPEGGFSEKEFFLAKEKGFEESSLGPRILKAETAAVCSAFLCQHLFGDIK